MNRLHKPYFIFLFHTRFDITKPTSSTIMERFTTYVKILMKKMLFRPIGWIPIKNN